MSKLKERLDRIAAENLDISKHLWFLYGLALDADVKSIVEIGFRTGVSATAFAATGKKLTCVDIDSCRVGRQKLAALGARFEFIHGDSLKVTIPKCDLLHIDSFHTHKHLSAELRAHAFKSSKWIALHDTETFRNKGKDGSVPGLHAAIMSFIEEQRGRWTLHLHLPHNNGMTLLRRMT